MPFLNPVHGLVVPFLCLFTLPVAIFAGITSAFAFSLLMFRVAIVYVDIAMAFVPQFIKGRHYHSITDGELPTPRLLPSSSRGSRGSYGSSRAGTEDNSPSAVVSPSPYYQYGYDSHQRSPLRRKSSYGFGAVRRSRRSSQASISPTITSIREDAEIIPPLPESGGLAPSVGIERDFEGVGGWRLKDNDDDAWENINSRLELPMERCSSFVGRYHHSLSHRSHSVGPSQSLEGGWMGASTNRKGMFRNGSGNGSGIGSGHGAEAQTSWNGTGARANRTASGSISKMLALTPSGGRNNHNGNGASPMGMLEQEQEQGYFAGFLSQKGKWRPMA